MNRKKINNLNEIYDGKKLLIKNFTNLDLSNIDLSNIPTEEWEDCIFFNTSFKNTGIKFIPNKLRQVDNRLSNACVGYWTPHSSTRQIYISYCDFSNNDLSFLKRKDFCYENSETEINKYGCNFRNTGINCIHDLENVTLDSSYGEYDYEFFQSKPIDINTIIKNQFLNISSAKFLRILESFAITTAVEKSKLDKNFYSDDNFKKEVVKQCEEYLKYDKEGHARTLYYKVFKNCSLNDKYEFFHLRITHTHLKDIDLTGIPIDVLKLYWVQNNKIERIIINNPIDELLQISEHNFLDTIRGYENEYSDLMLTGINYGSWQENLGAARRVSSSAITFFAKVYLELSRTCNARCSFCRNNSFEKSNYDLENIKTTLYMIKDYINAVVIGGGEPTLRLDDVKHLRDFFEDSKIDWHMFTNGSNCHIIDDDYIMDKFKINLSRHSISDDENANIFNIDVSKIMTSKDIERLNYRNKDVTLNATCFKGGMDTPTKIIDYINYAKEIGCKKVLIQDLQQNTSLGQCNINYDSQFINPDVFDDVILYLKDNGYRQKDPIYATGGYVSYVFKSKDNFSVSIQKYISFNQLQENWIKALKRSFDLSIDPEGNLYENWHQTSGLVKKIIKK